MIPSIAARRGLPLKALVIVLMAAPLASAQSPFDGAWVLDPPVPQKPIEYSLVKGLFHCTGCIANVEIKADGVDHRIAETDYWDTLNVQTLDAHAVEIIAKKAGKTMYMEFAT